MNNFLYESLTLFCITTLTVACTSSSAPTPAASAARNAKPTKPSAPVWIGTKVNCSIEETNRTNFCYPYPFEVTRQQPIFMPISLNYSAVEIIGIQFNEPTLKMGHTTIPLLTSSSCDFLPNLEEYYANATGIQEVDENAFYKCNNLTTLNLHVNKIKFLKRNTFNRNINLELLDLHENRLESPLDPDLFKNLRNLKILALDCNKLYHVSWELFADLIQLNTLNLDSNYITDIDPSHILNNSLELQQLYLQDNDFRCKRLKRIIEILKPARIQVLATFRCNSIRKRQYMPKDVNDVICLSEEQYLLEGHDMQMLDRNNSTTMMSVRKEIMKKEGKKE